MKYGRSDAYDELLGEICMEMGFCGDFRDGKPYHVDDSIPAQGAVSADDFVGWAISAEGMDPDGEAARKCAPLLREAFIRHMGAEVVDAQAFGLN